MNTPVSFELAKLLKEKGINIPSNRGLGVAIYEDGKITSTCLYDGTVIHAPTIAEVVMWLYEKHGIWITVTSISQESWQCHMTKKGDSLGKCYLEDFYNPTEAYEAAILYTLNNLI
jgi:hypothetical protein